MKPSKYNLFLDSLDLCEWKPDLDLGNVYVPHHMKTKLFHKVLGIRVDELIISIENINRKKDTDRNKLGDVGEKFVDNLKWVLGDRYFLCRDSKKYSRYSQGDDRNSYSIYYHYKSPPYSPRGGIDNRISIIDEIGDRYNISIEVKNWKKIRWISKGMFANQFLDRFSVCDENDYKVLAIPRCNIHLITDLCRENGIRILPLETQITPETDRDTLMYSLKSFYWEFDNLLEDIMYRNRNSWIRRTYYTNRKNPHRLSVDDIGKIVGLTGRQIQRIVKGS